MEVSIRTGRPSRDRFHGTGDAGIECFEHRQPVDLAPLGDQKAVFALSSAAVADTSIGWPNAR
jgi:hypothetical protein